MKRASTLFLRLVIGLVTIGVFAGMIFLPPTEGRAKDLDLISIYADPLIIYTYIASLSFFYGVYQAFKLLRLIDSNKAFSQEAITAVRKMKFASFCLIGFIILSLIFIRFFTHGDDSAGPTGLGILISLLVAVIATATAIGQKLLQNAVDLKSENDLTV